MPYVTLFGEVPSFSVVPSFSKQVVFLLCRASDKQFLCFHLSTVSPALFNSEQGYWYTAYEAYFFPTCIFY